MRGGVLAAVLGAMLALAGTAQAVTLVTPDGRSAQPYQRWADGAWTFTVRQAVAVRETPEVPCTTTACVTMPDGPIWIDNDAPTHGEPDIMQTTTLHEIGHLFDSAMPNWARTRFAKITRDYRPWLLEVGDPRFDGGDPMERFAVAYSVCGRGLDRAIGKEWARQARLLNSPSEELGYGLVLNWRQYRKVCGMICRVGRNRPTLFAGPTTPRGIRAARAMCDWR